jgi:two-component sensor histidine kinase
MAATFTALHAADQWNHRVCKAASVGGLFHSNPSNRKETAPAGGAQARWSNADFANTVRGATAPYDNEGVGRFSIAGPDIKITSGAVIALAMTLNELCTNTTKFGALSVPTGSIDIAWTIDEGMQRLQLIWSETGGPPVRAPSRQSFGTRLIGSLGQQLKGQVQLAYDATGFVYTLGVPMTSLVAPA